MDNKLSIPFVSLVFGQSYNKSNRSTTGQEQKNRYSFSDNCALFPDNIMCECRNNDGYGGTIKEDSTINLYCRGERFWCCNDALEDKEA